MRMKLNSIAGAVALGLSTCGIMISGTANAQSSNEALKQQVDLLKEQLELVRGQLDKVVKQLAAAPAAPVTAPAASGNHDFLERKTGDGLTFFTRGGEVSIYGNLDISVDAATKGLDGMTVAGVPPAGRVGWMADISTNLSYVGVRGFQTLGTFPANFVYQLETQIDVSAASGTSASNSNTSSVVKGGLTSRNSFIGLASPQWGALKIGKTDAPYKTSTASMNPFSGMLGDYSVIMANTGGDNRVEFGTRLDHALWYESPSAGGFFVNALASPGQNRGHDNSNLAAGEGDCSGGNVPGSGGLPVACNDGAYGAAYSVSAGYRNGRDASFHARPYCILKRRAQECLLIAKMWRI